MAAKALGRLAQASGTLTAVFVVEFEVKRALEWLQDARHESRRYAAVLVLKELAENAPTLFYVHVASFFDLVWYCRLHPDDFVHFIDTAHAPPHAPPHTHRSALHDNNVSIREGAVDALHAALALISERENRLRLQWYHKIYEEAQKGLRQNTVPTIHGSLITLGTPLRPH
jgi:FKBP12-rapamycin complex-associated protein